MVLTLTPARLSQASKELSEMVKNAGFSPHLILCVLQGGRSIAQEMRTTFPAAHYAEIPFSRPLSKKKKQRSTARLLRHLPLCLCDLLREVERCYVSYKAKRETPIRTGQVVLPLPVEQHLAQLTAQHIAPAILLVDDAIDTGATMATIYDQLHTLYPTAVIRIAVITVTTRTPLLSADFSRYANQTLCRFPWSTDYR